MKHYLRYWRILCVMALMLAFAGSVCSVSAEEQAQVVITRCEGYQADTIAIAATLPENRSGICEIYRGTQDPAAGGQLSLVDTIQGNSWSTQNGGAWYTTGDRDKIVCYSNDSKLAGEVQFFDPGVQFGVTYYYQIVLRDDWDDEIIARSNVASAQAALETPEFIRTYARTNSSAALSWIGFSKAHGYEIYRKTGSKWKRIKTISKASTTTFTDKKVKAGKTYSYRVRAYRTVDGKRFYSNYSGACKVKLKKPTVKGSYGKGSVYGPSLGTDKLADVRRVVQSFKDNYIRKGMSDYEKVWMAFCYIRANCDYAWRGWQYNGANTAWGALVYGEAQCSGYARGMKALCDAISVPCHYVHANSKASNPSHQWNQVKVGGKWYILDAQGGFFLVGSDVFKNFVGMNWNTKGLPKCSKKNHARGGFISSEM